MSQRHRARYVKGSFVPAVPYDLPEGAEVELIIQGPAVVPPAVTDAAERDRILAEIVERMQNNPIPPAAPPLTRESLYSEDFSAYLKEYLGQVCAQWVLPREPLLPRAA